MVVSITMNYSNILVTGGAGFIGSHLVNKLIDKGYEVTVLDNLDSGHLQNFTHHQGKENFHFKKGDIRNYNLVRTTMKDIDAVFHEAAIASVILSVKNPLLVNDVNVTGTLNLLKSASDIGINRFIYASSASVYGQSSSALKREDMIPNPTSPYGISKLAAEYYVRLWHELYGLETVSLRYFNVYGPRQRFDIHCAYGGAITIFTNRLLKDMPPIIYGDGKQTRDFVYIDDVIRASILALESEEAAGDVFNIATGNNISVNEVAETLKDILNKKELKNIYDDPQPADIRHSYADIDKAKRLLGYNPHFDIEQGLTKLIKWYTNTPSLYQS